MYPILLHAGNFYLPTFGALAALGLMLALALSQRTARTAKVDPDRLWDAGLFAVLAAFVASRLLLVVEHLRSFVAFPLLLLAVPSLAPSGLLLTAVATFLWLRARRIPWRRALDAWAPCATLVWAFLALGHFAEGSDPGLQSRFGLPLPGSTMRLAPVALYACALAVLLTLAACVCLRRGRPAGETAGLTLAAAGCGQFFLSFLRQPGVEAGAGLDTLQIVSLGLVVAGACLVTFSEASASHSAASHPGAAADSTGNPHTG